LGLVPEGYGYTRPEPSERTGGAVSHDSDGPPLARDTLRDQVSHVGSGLRPDRAAVAQEVPALGAVAADRKSPLDFAPGDVPLAAGVSRLKFRFHAVSHGWPLK